MANDANTDDEFSSLFDLLPVGAYRSRPDGKMLRANAALVRFNGYASEAELLRAVHDIAQEWYVEPGRREVFRAALERDGSVVAFVSEVHRHRTRERAWISENAHLVRSADGRVLHYEGTVEDVTGRVLAERALRENERRWKLALEVAGDGVWDWNLATGTEIVSDRLLQMYGLDAEAHGGRPDALDALTHPDDRAAMIAAREAHWRGETPAYVNEHRMRGPDGCWRWVLSRGMVIERDADGRPTRMIGIHTDIDARKEAEALRRERDLAEQAQQAQTAFLSRVSHELRTPLNAIIGFAQLLELGTDSEERRGLWQRTILDSGRHLLALVDDLLVLSSAKTGQLQFAVAEVALAPLVDAVLAMHAGAAREAALAIDGRVGDGLAVRADATRLKQVVSNLVSNAIKYNRRGGRVTLTAEPAGADIALSVADTGPGLSAERLARLFNPFERAGAQHTTIAGTGLGLALARQLVEAMGGTIGVASRLGEGSTFTVRLPAARPGG